MVTYTSQSEGFSLSYPANCSRTVNPSDPQDWVLSLTYVTGVRHSTLQVEVKPLGESLRSFFRSWLADPRAWGRADVRKWKVKEHAKAVVLQEPRLVRVNGRSAVFLEESLRSASVGKVRTCGFFLPFGHRLYVISWIVPDEDWPVVGSLLRRTAMSFMVLQH
jgi:hypothetical protein